MSIRPSTESLSLMVIMSWEMPTSSTTGENIWLMITKPRKAFLPLNRMRAMA